MVFQPEKLVCACIYNLTRFSSRKCEFDSRLRDRIGERLRARAPRHGRGGNARGERRKMKKIARLRTMSKGGIYNRTHISMQEPITILDVPGLYITIVEINLGGTSSVSGPRAHAYTHAHTHIHTRGTGHARGRDYMPAEEPLTGALNNLPDFSPISFLRRAPRGWGQPRARMGEPRASLEGCCSAYEVLFSFSRVFCCCSCCCVCRASVRSER